MQTGIRDWISEWWTAEVELKVKEAAGLLVATLETVVASTVARLQLPSVHCTVSCMQLAVPVVWVPCWGRGWTFYLFFSAYTHYTACTKSKIIAEVKIPCPSLDKRENHTLSLDKRKNTDNSYIFILQCKTGSAQMQCKGCITIISTIAAAPKWKRRMCVNCVIRVSTAKWQYVSWKL